jgi:hypothetical protein
MLLSRPMKASSLEILERSQLPPSQARAIFQVMEAELSAREHTLATRADLDQGLHGLELKVEAVRTEMQSLRAELKSDIRDTVRWNFAFWVAQLAAMAAILKLIK